MKLFNTRKLKYYWQGKHKGGRKKKVIAEINIVDTNKQQTNNHKEVTNKITTSDLGGIKCIPLTGLIKK